MKYLYSILCFLLFAAAGTSAQQKDALTEFAAKMASSKAEFHYSFILDDGRVKMTGEGTVAVQGSSYYMTGNGLEIWCDGKSRWTSDSAAREAVIESVGEGMELAANPALLVSNLDREFSWSGNGVPGTFNGSPAKVFYLKANSNADIKGGFCLFRQGRQVDNRCGDKASRRLGHDIHAFILCILGTGPSCCVYPWRIFRWMDCH